MAIHSFLHWPVQTSALRGTPALKDPRLVTTPAKQAELINDLWRFFEVKGRGEFSLGYLDLGAAWRTRFVELCNAGHMQRDRLLDASLAALNRDFNEAETRCFVRLYTELEPTAEEQHVRCGKLLALLDAEVSSTVSFAVKAIKQLNKHDPIPAADLIKALRPVFLSPGKGVVMDAIGLVKDAAKRAPDTKPEAIDAIMQALRHKHESVSNASLAALENWAADLDPKALRELQASVPALLPSVQARALALLDTTGRAALS
ncbi:DUF6493 family protein [Yoonia sp. BS5-3]|uniref:DUF6493 family protein n=1 Tax=Yoonia phaeophyticola TaxID=3137369 RepID=A0ABZ2V3P3_9RHOB